MAKKRSARGERHLTIMTTMKYEMFVRHPRNRPYSEVGVRRKVRAFKRMGQWVPGCPMLCVRKPGGKLMVYDGQNRLDAAARLQIPVWYVIDPQAAAHEPKDFNCNDAQSSWTISQYVDVEADAGNKHYVELRNFAKTYGLPYSICATLLQGMVACGGNILKAIQSGDFEVLDLSYAQETAAVIASLLRINKDLRGPVMCRAIARCMLVRDKGFDPAAFITKCSRLSHQLHPCGTVDQYCSMFETIYNYQSRKSNKIPLAFVAKEAVAARSPIKRTTEPDG